MYKHCIEITDGSIVTHTVENPYPSFNNNNNKSIIKQKNIALNNAIQRLTCFTTKQNPIEDKDVLLGYPIELSRDRYQRITSYPLFEILSYEGYIKLLSDNPEKLDSFDGSKLKTAMGQFFNYWMPIYINEKCYI